MNLSLLALHSTLLLLAFLSVITYKTSITIIKVTITQVNKRFAIQNSTLRILQLQFFHLTGHHIDRLSIVGNTAVVGRSAIHASDIVHIVQIGQASASDRNGIAILADIDVILIVGIVRRISIRTIHLRGIGVLGAVSLDIIPWYKRKRRW